MRENIIRCLSFLRSLVCLLFLSLIEKNNFFSLNNKMLCEFILISVKNKGKQCSLKGKITFETKGYCTRHYKIQEDAEKHNACTLTVENYDIIKKLERGHLEE